LLSKGRHSLLYFEKDIATLLSTATNDVTPP